MKHKSFTAIPVPNYDKELKEIKELITQNSLQSKEIMTIDEASVFTGLSKSTLYKYTSSMRITHYKSEKKIYFKKTDLEAFMLQKEVKSFDEINQDVERQLFNSRNK